MPDSASFRRLKFETTADLYAEVDRIVAAERDGKLQCLGNWTAGQNCAHLAAWIEYGYDGFPIKPPPFPVRWFFRFARKRLLRGPMPKGVKIPGVANGTVGQDDMPLHQAAERLKAAFGRLDAGEEAVYHSPAFGKMNHDERTQLNLRHAELHFGNLVYETS